MVTPLHHSFLLLGFLFTANVMHAAAKPAKRHNSALEQHHNDDDQHAKKQKNEEGQPVEPQLHNVMEDNLIRMIAEYADCPTTVPILQESGKSLETVEPWTVTPDGTFIGIECFEFPIERNDYYVVDYRLLSQNLTQPHSSMLLTWDSHDKYRKIWNWPPKSIVGDGKELLFYSSAAGIYQIIKNKRTGKCGQKRISCFNSRNLISQHLALHDRSLVCTGRGWQQTIDLDTQKSTVAIAPVFIATRENEAKLADGRTATMQQEYRQQPSVVISVKQNLINHLKQTFKEINY